MVGVEGGQRLHVGLGAGREVGQPCLLHGNATVAVRVIAQHAIARRRPADLLGLPIMVHVRLDLRLVGGQQFCPVTV
ncbi:hypothetical protein D3C72_1825930 [compost metagenome]